MAIRPPTRPGATHRRTCSGRVRWRSRAPDDRRLAGGSGASYAVPTRRSRGRGRRPGWSPARAGRSRSLRSGPDDDPAAAVESEGRRSRPRPMATVAPPATSAPAMLRWRAGLASGSSMVRRSVPARHRVGEPPAIGEGVGGRSRSVGRAARLGNRRARRSGMHAGLPSRPGVADAPDEPRPVDPGRSIDHHPERDAGGISSIDHDVPSPGGAERTVPSSPTSEPPAPPRSPP
jgi:hypothetical protein